MSRLLLLAALLAGCAEQSLRPTFPAEAAGQPVVVEQALLGLSDEGDAAAAQLVDVEGAVPRLSLLAFDHDGKPTRTLVEAPQAIARQVSQRLRQEGKRQAQVLAGVLVTEWPEAAAMAADFGFKPQAPAAPEPGRRRWAVVGNPRLGSLPLALRLSEGGDDPRALLLLLAEGPGAGPSGDEIELARMPLSGATVHPELWVQGGTVWIVGGSIALDHPLHRSVGLRRGSLARGEAQLHNAHGLTDYAAGDLDSARREFDRAIACDPGFVDGLYNAASSAALVGRTADAVGLLRRAAALDPGRVQVLGRNDEDLRLLRNRADVRELLGLKRPPPSDVP